MEWNKFLLFIFFFNKLVTNKLIIYIDYDNINNCESEGVSRSGDSGSGGGGGGNDAGGNSWGDRNDSRMAVVDCYGLSGGGKVLWLRW